MLVANKRPDNKVIGVNRLEGALILSTNNGKIRLEPKSEEIIRVVYTLKEEFSTVDKEGVIYKDKYEDWDYSEEDNEIILTTSKLTLRINKETSSIQYYDKTGKLLLKEKRL